MCSYNRVNGDYACENDYLLNDVLKKSWGFKGWVMSDWGGTHSTVKAALAGLDQEMPGDTAIFGDALKKAVESGRGADGAPGRHGAPHPAHRVRVGHLRHIRRSPGGRRRSAGSRWRSAWPRQGTVLLKNDRRPAAAERRHDQVDRGDRLARRCGRALRRRLGAGGRRRRQRGSPPEPTRPAGRWAAAVVAPLRPAEGDSRARRRRRKVDYNDGTDPAAAAALAKASDVAIVFVNPADQRGPRRREPDAAGQPGRSWSAAVAAANPHTIVVLETGGPVRCRGSTRCSAVLEIWYPGIRGAEAIANILFGDVNPSGKLPMTFPKSEADLPHPVLRAPTDAAAGAAHPRARRPTRSGGRSSRRSTSTTPKG